MFVQIISNLYFTDRLPYSIRVLLESAVRNCDNFSILEQDVNHILQWEINQNSKEDIEIPFKPARVILHVSCQTCCYHFLIHNVR